MLLSCRGVFLVMRLTEVNRYVLCPLFLEELLHESRINFQVLQISCRSQVNALLVAFLWLLDLCESWLADTYDSALG